MTCTCTFHGSKGSVWCSCGYQSSTTKLGEAIAPTVMHDKFCPTQVMVMPYFCCCGLIEAARADEREQAARRVIDVETVGLCHPCAYDKATFVAAARGEDGPK